MPYANRTPFFRVCTNCGKERYTTYKQHHSGLCRSCATSRRQQGSKRSRHFLPGSLYAEETLARFWSKVAKGIPCSCHSLKEQCWLWTARIEKSTGYGAFSVDGYPISTHRFAYQSTHGIMPDGIYVLHTPPCITRHCVRHLYAGTPQQNMDDAKAMHRFPTGAGHAATRDGYTSLVRGDEHWTHTNPQRMPRAEDHWTHRKPEDVHKGEDHPMATLTDIQVCAIRNDFNAGMSLETLVRKYVRSKSNIHAIVRRKIWTHLP